MAGEASVTARRSVTIAGLTIGGVTETIAAESQREFQKTFAAGSADVLVTLPHTVANAIAQAIVADQDCTVKTNSSGSPAQTFALKANQPLIWMYGQVAASKIFTTNVTGFYVTCANETLLKIGIAETL
jgi:hypothetical protein